MSDYKQYFQCLLDASDSVIIFFNTAFEIKAFNKKAKEIFAWEENAVLEKHLIKTFDKHHIENPINRILDSIEPGESIPLKESKVCCQNQKYTIAWYIRYWPPKKSSNNFYVLEGRVTQSSYDFSGIGKDLSQVLDRLPCAIFWKDKNSVYKGGNAHFLEYTGYHTIEEVIGKTDFDLPWKDEAKSFIKDDQEVLETSQEKLNIEDTLKISDGSVLNVITNKTPWRDNTGKVIGVLGIAIDFTNQKFRELSLQESILLERGQFLDQTQTLKTITQELLGLDFDTDHPSNSKKLVTFLKAIVADMPGNVFWKDTNSVYMGCNNHVVKVCGLSNRFDIVGLTDIKLERKLNWIPGTAERFRQDDIEVITSKKRKTFEDVFSQADGKEVTMLTTKTPIFNDADEVAGILAASLDITALKQKESDLQSAKQQAEVASKAKSDFLSNMSHDFRTPMTGIIGMMDCVLIALENAQATLQSEPSSNPRKSNYQALVNDIRELTAQAKTSSNELTNFLVEIIDSVRLESGEIKANKKAFDIAQLIQHNLDLHQSVAMDKKLIFTAHIGDDVPPYLYGIRHCFSRALSNLISNALKFTESGTVTLSVDLAEGLPMPFKKGDIVILHVRVKDTGIGIPKDQLGTIFEKFVRLSPSYKAHYQGTGLGLSITKEYLDMMKARISVDSEPNQGSCFTITADFIVDDHADPIIEEDKPRETVTTTKPTVEEETILPLLATTQFQTIPKLYSTRTESRTVRRILLVEDAPMLILVLKKTLSTLGFAVDHAENGEAAVEKVRTNDYDAILMDIGLPGINGVEATKRIRALDDPQRSQVPIIAHTGHAKNTDWQKQCYDAGMQDVLNKPTSNEILKATLDRFILERSATKPYQGEAAASEAATQDLSIIDWKECLKKCGDDVAFTRQQLKGFSESLNESKTIFSRTYLEKDWETLRFELHKVRGVVMVFTLPHLFDALAKFHKAVKAEPQDKVQLNKTYDDTMKAIKQFQTIIEQGDFGTL